VAHVNGNNFGAGDLFRCLQVKDLESLTATFRACHGQS
jgi:hypothetical protein